jgi:hypothetical protein
MSQNFNVDPYYDDFDPSKNFHRILFKPGYAVQARELTQSQTILQSQISKFADNIFTQNTPVTGGKTSVNLKCSYLKLNSTYDNSPITASDFLNKIIRDDSGTILAKVIGTSEQTGTSTNPGDPPTLVISYLSGVKFTDASRILTTDNSNLFATTTGITGGSTCTGSSSTASVSDGVFYVVNGYSVSSTQNQDGSYSKYSIGNFVSVQPQTIILNKYSNTPSYRVGLQIKETRADSISDTSLLDPAVGASNYQAPGADRYQIILTLTALPLGIGNDDQFIELLRIENGSIVKQVDGTVYSVIDDYFAKRDYETNGDYIVEDFKLTPATNTNNASTYNLKVGKGIAYVRGYRIQNQSDIVLTSNRARTQDSINNNNLYVDYGNYFYVDTLNNTFDVSKFPFVDLHSVGPSGIDSSNTATYHSTLVGTAHIRNISFDSSTSDSNTQTYIYKTYLSDISANTLSSTAKAGGSSTTIPFLELTPGQFSSTANAYYGATISITSGTSSGDARRIVSYNGTTKVATVDKPFTLTPDTSTAFSVQLSTKVVESLVQVNGSYAITASANINAVRGKENGFGTGDTIFSSSNRPELLLQFGHPYVGTVSDSSYVSSRVFRSKTFGVGNAITLTSTTGNPIRFLGADSSDAIKQNYIVIEKSTGKVLDFITSGNTITVGANTDQVTFTSSTYAGKTVDIIAQVSVSSGDATSYVLKSKNLVTGNTTHTVSTSGTHINNTYVSTTLGQTYVTSTDINRTKMSLYVSDVKKLTKVIHTKSLSLVVTDAMLMDSTYDVTSLFKLDNGQKDSYYDHASVSLVPGASMPVGNLLFIYDFYTHSGGDGYFSVRSYLSAGDGGVSTSPEIYAYIPTYTSSHRINYKLSDCLDFRPTRKNAQSTFVIDTTTNTDAGMLIPANLSTFTSTYSYYLGRKDLLILSKDGNFKILEGSPSSTPIEPDSPEGSLIVAKITHDPYTAVIPGETMSMGITSVATTNLSINKVIYKRWIKKDITDLQTRVNNIEYYQSLNLLEQKAQALQVPDSNGLNRFKNGILVDDFSSYLTADTYNRDFMANINTRKNQLTPLTLVDNFQLQNPIALNSLGTVKTTNIMAIASISGTQTNLFTLPYTNVDTIIQPLATSTISLNPFSLAITQGVVKLSPPMDNWIDIRTAPTIMVTDDKLQLRQEQQGLNLTNMGDFNALVDKTTDDSVHVLPFIRPQQLIFRAKGLLVNTPVSAWFDGRDVSNSIQAASTIELKNVTGKFNEDDIIGFYVSAGSKFYPTGRVVSVYNYPNGTDVRLYISAVVGQPQYTSTQVIQNAKFDASGVYIAGSKTASGTINNGVSSLKLSGSLTGVGGGYTPVGGSGTYQIYKTNNPSDWGSFMNQYSVWGNLAHYTSTAYVGTFNVNIPDDGTYTILASASTSTPNIYIDSVSLGTISGPTTVSTFTKTLTAGSHVISWNIPGNSSIPLNGVAVVAKDSGGNIVFESTNPPNLNYDSVDQELLQVGGGAWFTGVTKIKLDAQASNVDNFYAGAKITVVSKFYVEQNVETASYYPPPPPPANNDDGCGGGCFTGDTMVNMANGKKKKISDIKVGDEVMNFDGTSTNKVLFVEKLSGEIFETLYSPDKKYKAFATANHPLYINGKLSAVDPEFNYSIYPWLGKNEKLIPIDVVPATSDLVYNLWTDGDCTYIVNGYGTTTIIGDGGVVRLAYEQGLITAERASEIIVKFTDAGMKTVYGAYLFNETFGKLNWKPVNSFLAAIYADKDKNKVAQKFVDVIFGIVGSIAMIFKNK